MSSQMPLGNASVVSKGDETEKEHGKNVGVINVNILQKQNINMKYNNANSKSDEVSPTAILVSKNNVKNNNVDNNNYITNQQTPQLITSGCNARLGISCKNLGPIFHYELFSQALIAALQLIRSVWSFLVGIC